MKQDYLKFAQSKGMSKEDASAELNHWLRFGDTAYNKRTQIILATFVKQGLEA